MAHAQKADFISRRNRHVHLNRRGRQFSRLLTAEVCTSVVVMLDTPCSEVVWRVLATHSIHLFPLHFPSRASPCTITFQLESTTFTPSLKTKHEQNNKLAWQRKCVITKQIPDITKPTPCEDITVGSSFPNITLQSYYQTQLWEMLQEELKTAVRLQAACKTDEGGE
jgi:hypothetical protein